MKEDDIVDSVPMVSLAEQRRFVFEQSNKIAIKQLNDNANAPIAEALIDFNEQDYSHTHLLEKQAGYEPPHEDLVKYYCDQLKAFDSSYTQKEIAREILGINDRRLREYIQGKHKVPFELWRKILIATGRAPQEIQPVIAYCE